MKVKLDFDVNKIKADKEKRIKKAQFLLDQQVLKDSNLYVPEDVGTLKDKGTVKTGGGFIMWDIEYAKAQYYDKPNKSKDRNPYAQMKWFEVAKAKNKKLWEKLVNDQYNK